MGAFHVFKIVQVVPNRATHHIFHSGEKHLRNPGRKEIIPQFLYLLMLKVHLVFGPFQNIICLYGIALILKVIIFLFSF